MTAWRHRLVWALPFGGTSGGVANLEMQRRLGVAVYTAGYTNQQRLQIINGTLAYNPNDPNLDNFVRIWSRTPDGSTQDFYLGAGSATDAEWSRIQSRIASVDVQLRYGRWLLDEQTGWALAETNVNLLNPYIGQNIEEYDALVICGLVPYIAPA